LLPASGVSNDETLANAIRAQGTTFIGYPLEVTSGTKRGKITPGFVTKMATPAPLAYGRVQVPDEGPPPPVPEAVAYLPNLPVINSAAPWGRAFESRRGRQTNPHKPL
jgi:hypothetical protein